MTTRLDVAPTLSGRVTTERHSVDFVRERSARDLSGVTPAIDDGLRDLGIRTVAELASAKADVLAAESAGVIGRSDAETLITIAKQRIEDK